MRILWRYIFREFLIPLAYCLAGFVGIYILFELFGSFSRMAASDMTFGETVNYLAAYLSPFFKYLAPAALMLATLYTMWSFCRHSELTAMRASGVSLMTIVRPLLFAALLVAIFVSWVNEFYMPEHALWAKRLRAAKFDKAEASVLGAPAYTDTERRHTWTVMDSGDSSCAHLKGVRLVLRDREPEVRFDGIDADWLDGEWWLTVTNAASQISYMAGGLAVASPNPELDKVELRTIPGLDETPYDIKMQQTDAIPYGSVALKLRFAREAQNLTAEKRRDVTYDAWAQLLSPLACFIITLLAIPAGISTGRQAVFSGILGALGLFFAYYGLDMASLVFAKTGLVPPVLAAFIAPVVFFALAVYNFFRPMRLTLILAGAMFALVALYVASAHVLEVKLGVTRAMAHSLSLTLPALMAGYLLYAMRPKKAV